MVSETANDTEITQESLDALDASQQTPAGADSAQGDGGLTPAPEADGTSAPEGQTDQESGEAQPFDFDSLASEVLGTAPKPEAKPELPGRSVQEIEAQERLQRAARYAQIMQSADPTEALQRQYGLDEQTAREVWQNGLRPWLNQMHADYEAFNYHAHNGAIRSVLSEEEQKAFFGREYSTRAEAFAALKALGKQEAEKAVASRVESGELVTREQAKKIAESAYLKGEQAGLNNKDAATGGQHANGGRSGSRRRYTDDQIRQMTPQQVAAILDEPDGAARLGMA